MPSPFAAALLLFCCPQAAVSRTAALDAPPPATGPPSRALGPLAPSELRLPFQQGWPVSVATGAPSYRYPSEPAVADLDGDGEREVVVHFALGSQTATRLDVYDRTGNLLPGWPVMLASSVSLEPIVGDVDGDGDLEIFSGSLAFHHDATQLAGWPLTEQVTGLANLDGDPELELIGISGLGDYLAGSGRKLYAWEGTGSLLPGFPVELPSFFLGGLGPYMAFPCAPATGDLDGDGDLEIVVAGHVATTESDIADVYVYDHEGQPVDGWPRRVLAGQADLILLHTPVLADLEGDGDDEVIVALRPVNQGALIQVLEGGGAPRAGWPVVIPGPVAVQVALSAGDVDSSPGLEVVATVQRFPLETVELYVFGAAGQLLYGGPRVLPGYGQSTHQAYGPGYSADWSQPILVDLFGDARLEILHVLRRSPAPGSPSEHCGFVWPSGGGEAIRIARLPGATFAGSFLATDLDADGDVELAVVGRDALGVATIRFWDARWRPPGPGSWPMWSQDVRRSSRLR